MAYTRSDDRMRRALALLAAAIVAPPVAALLVFISPWTYLTIPNSGAVAGLVLLSVPLGLLGACLFLGIAFRLVRGRRSRWAFGLAGAGAGLAHSAVGLAIVLGFARLVAAAGDWWGWIGAATLFGGFVLIGMPGEGVVPATFIASAIAGMLAGLVYWRIGVPTDGLDRE